MFSCSCGFETISIRTLRSHYAANHGNGTSFFEIYKDIILDNWESFPIKAIRGFMLWIAKNKCSSCGYDKTRECGTTILEVDHIDGNHGNNRFDNLRVLCPNCHALTPKYRNWSNKGNKKNTKILRPGNLGYDDRFEALELQRIEKICIQEAKKAERERIRELKRLELSRNLTLKDSEAEVYKEFQKIKSNFQQDFIDRVKAFHESGEIDFSKYGWVQILSDRLNEKPQVVGRRIRSLLPNFYVKHCYSRRYNHYVKWEHGVDPAR